MDKDRDDRDGITLIVLCVWCPHDKKDDNIVLSYYMFGAHLLLTR